VSHNRFAFPGDSPVALIGVSDMVRLHYAGHGAACIKPLGPALKQAATDYSNLLASFLTSLLASFLTSLLLLHGWASG
jgi:hypothetical protein